jgi:hypothetical protein
MTIVIVIIRVVQTCYRKSLPNHSDDILDKLAVADNTNNNITPTSSSPNVTPNEGAASYSIKIFS